MCRTGSGVPLGIETDKELNVAAPGLGAKKSKYLPFLGVDVFLLDIHDDKTKRSIYSAVGEEVSQKWHQLAQSDIYYASVNVEEQRAELSTHLTVDGVQTDVCIWMLRINFGSSTETHANTPIRGVGGVIVDPIAQLPWKTEKRRLDGASRKGRCAVYVYNG
jgi:hypothetical protein